MKARLLAWQILELVINQKKSLNHILESKLKMLPLKDRPFVQELVYGVLRFYSRYQTIIEHFAKKSCDKLDEDIILILMIGFYQLEIMRVQEHAAINETVEVVRAIKKTWALKFVNALLRRFQREGKELSINSLEFEFSHPLWIIKLLRSHWPDQYKEILSVNNQKPPFTLRVNQRLTSTAAYLQELTIKQIQAKIHPVLETAIVLEQSVNINDLPGFTKAWVSVQDASAQLAAHLLAPHSQERVLDACAAPGGKTLHLLEYAPDIHLTAVDIEKERVTKIAENLKRAGQSCQLIQADIVQVKSWCDGQEFDRILCDVPCSALGVIRRHPDIKYLRTAEDIKSLTQLQENILNALWPLLKVGGKLLYVTCSILPEENEQQIEQFLKRHSSAKALPFTLPFGIKQQYGWQILPAQDQGDGFYYALLEKIAS